MRATRSADRAYGQLGHGDRVPPELAGEIGDGEPAGPGEVVGAGRPAAEHGGAHRARHVVVMHQLEGHPRIGQHGLEYRHASRAAASPLRAVAP